MGNAGSGSGVGCGFRAGRRVRLYTSLTLGVYRVGWLAGGWGEMGVVRGWTGGRGKCTCAEGWSPNYDAIMQVYQ